jgi:predicted RNase H-like nuclease (RuvC/YqgF family)
MNYKTIPELKRVLSGGIYRHLGLYTADGQKIKPFNTKIAAFEDQAKEILNFLESNIVEPGIYVLKLKKTYSGAAVDYAINKGNIEVKEPIVLNTNSLNIPHDFAAAMSHPAIKLQSDITRLELENEDLQRQIEELNEYIGDLEEKITSQTLSEAPQPPSAFETAKSFLSEIVAFGAPLLDKHFELKAAQLEIERARVNKQQGTAPAQKNQYEAPEVKREKQIEQKIKEWINSKTEDQELSNNLMVLYYNSSDIGKFAERLNDFNTELYEECKQYVG